jgi:putative aldouronate transport system substrate-binding protein
MFSRTTGKATLAVLAALMMVLAGCNTASPAAASTPPASAAQTQAESAAPTPAPDPWGKYPETISLTTNTVLAGWMTLEPGEDQDNNWWTNIYLDKLNIKVTNKWAADGWGTPMDEKFNQALAADDLPDIIYAYTTLAMKAIKNDKVLDLTGLYDQYASEQLKSIYASDPNALKAWTMDGKLEGLPQGIRGTPTVTGFWIRKDWLDALGLPVPKTLSDVENVMREFIAKNPGKTDGGVYGFGAAWDAPFFNDGLPLFNIKGGQWVDENGQLAFDRLQPGHKAMWQKAADWYKEGLLPKDFAVKKSDPDINTDIVNGKCGVWWGYYSDVAGTTAMMDMKKKDSNIDFVFVYPPAVDGNPQQPVVASSYDGAILDNVKCKYPEAIIKIMNLGTAIVNEPKPDFITDLSYQHGATGTGWAEFWRCVGMSCPSDPTQGLRDVKAAQEALKSGDTSGLTFIAKQEYYDKMKNWLDKGMDDENWLVDWSTYWVDGPDGSVSLEIALCDSDNYTYSPWYGVSTDSITKNGANWDQKYQEYRTMAIVKDDVDKQFDDWVAFFHANGGDQATQEVNDWYATHK